MVWVGRDLKGHLVPTPCNEQGHVPLEVQRHSYHFADTQVSSFETDASPVKERTEERAGSVQEEHHPTHIVRLYTAKSIIFLVKKPF